MNIETEKFSEEDYIEAVRLWRLSPVNAANGNVSDEIIEREIDPIAAALCKERKNGVEWGRKLAQQGRELTA